MQGGICPDAIVSPFDTDCPDCEGTGSVTVEREATIDDLTDRQFQFLLEATRVKNGADEESQNQQQGPSPGGSPAGSPQVPHASGQTQHHGQGSYTHNFDV